ncbi:unnamed protein product [Owenia fusiformis]|uniref:Uncharacterized protein n=1 Tax=Owenia fusiformis TaxID=6347 RepID=A0A8J1XP11_OWEFU|nr:unnamed protein product [Owenia fusiformis]
MAASYHACVVFLFLPILIQYSNSEDVLGIQTDDFDFDGLPGAQHEFRIEVGAGKEECFFQKIAKGANLHVTFEVLRGADRNIDFIIKRADGSIFDSHLWTHEGTTEKLIEEEALYIFCLNNRKGRFRGSKLVFFYLDAYKEEDQQLYEEKLEMLDEISDNMETTLQKVDTSISKMRNFQAISRKHVIADWYLSLANNKYIQNLSIAMSCIIICTSCLQTYFVRKLFATKNVTSTQKPRA